MSGDIRRQLSIPGAETYTLMFAHLHGYESRSKFGLALHQQSGRVSCVYPRVMHALFVIKGMKVSAPIDSR